MRKRESISGGRWRASNNQIASGFIRALPKLKNPSRAEILRLANGYHVKPAVAVHLAAQVGAISIRTRPGSKLSRLPRRLVDPKSLTPVQQLAEAEERSQLEHAIRQLSPTSRQMLELRFGFTTGKPETHADIARITYRPKSQIPRLLDEAMNKLYRRMRRFDD